MEQEESVQRLSRDLAKAAATLSDEEARFFVSAYYQMQESRKRTENQSHSLVQNAKPHDVMVWLSEQNTTLENQVKRALDKYSDAHPLGKWARSIVGIGPVIAAGLLAHIDLNKAPTAGHIWRYAGLDPTSSWPSTADAENWVKQRLSRGNTLEETLVTATFHWGRKESTLERYATKDREGNPIPLTVTSLAKAISRRPYNADLKVLCWKIGESFVKVSNHDDDVYGKIYAARKQVESEKNEALEYAQQASDTLSKFNIGKDTEAYAAYSQSKLPKARIHARAQRYAVKIFLSHYWQIGRQIKGLPVVKPFAIAHLGHAHMIEPPAYRPV
jgi:hypothetical protein